MTGFYRVRLLTVFLLIFFTVTSQCFAKENPVPLHPPLDGELILTGTVGEFRPGFFHRGLDFSTGNRVGQKVYSVDEGYISKIAFHRYGIGLAVWISHPGNRESLYGHLNGLAPEILNHPLLPAEVREKTLRRQEFTVTFEENMIRVGRGMHIAFSGETGIGLPHLHMEYRVDGRFVNPLLYGLTVNDITPPVISEISIVPLSARSRINGRAEPLVLRLTEALSEPVREASGYRMDYTVLPDPRRKEHSGEGAILLSGPAGITVTGWDPFSKSRLGYKKGVLYRHDSQNKDKKKIIFSFDLNYLDPGSGDTEAFRNILLYDGIRSRISGGTTYVHYFFERVPGKLSFTESDNNGVIEFSGKETEKTLTVAASDTYGNYSQFTFVLRKDPAEYPQAAGFAEITGLHPEGMQLESEDGNFRVSLPEKSRIGSAALQIVSSAKTVVLPEGLTLKSSIYTLHPFTRDFLSDYQGVITAELSDKADVYRIEGNRIRRIDSVKKDNRYFFRQHATGSFAVIEDNSPPVWLTAKLTSTTDRGRRLLLYASDTGSGIDPDSAEVTINGTRVYTDYDADWNHLEVIYPETVFEKGTYVLKASIKDKAGNLSRPLVFRYTIG